MKKAIFSSILSLLVLFVMPQIIFASESWPSSDLTGTQIANYTDASGIIYHQRLNSFFIAVNSGYVKQIDINGAELSSKYIGSDLEAIAITDPNSDYIYLGIENPQQKIVQFSISNNNVTGKSWVLNNMVVDTSNGLESLEYVNGYFYAGSQLNTTIYVYSIDLNVSSAGVDPVRTFVPYADYTTDLAALSYSEETNTLYALYDGGNRLVIMDGNGNYLNRYKLPSDTNPAYSMNEEGFVVVPNCPNATSYAIIAEDSGRIMRYSEFQIGSSRCAVTSIDNDHDGYTSDIDCNDSDNTIHSTISYYRDADSDTYGTATGTLFCSSTAPAGYVTNNSDCDDTVAALNILASYPIYYLDHDSDGYGVDYSLTRTCSYTTPIGYSTNSSDCNDSDASAYMYQNFYVDNDLDSYGSTTTASVCSSATPAAGYALNNTDCDDNSSTIFSNTTFYQDADGDGLGNAGVSVSECAITKSGFVMNYTDTNDNDFDNDGYETGSDCNDQDASLSVNNTFYLDNDNDTYGFSSGTLFCLNSAPSGYVTNNTDCDDNNNTVFTNTTFYKDYDGDGLGNINDAVTECASAKSGYVNNSNDANDNDYDNDSYEINNDCNDKDSAIWMNQVYFQDLDGDGLGNPVVTQSMCSLIVPAGYVTNGNDLNDDDPTNSEPPVEQPILVISIAGRYIYINNQKIKIFDEKPKSVDYEVVNYYDDNMTEIIVVGLFSNRATIVTLQVNDTDYTAKIVKKEVIRFQQKRTTLSLKTKELNHRFITRFDHKKITWKIRKTATFAEIK